MTTAPFPGITHVAITVTDLAASVDWYRRLFAVDPVLDEDTGPFHHTVFLLGSTLFGVHAFPEGVPAEPFDERQVGLDHVAFGVADRAELEKWVARLDELGVAHSGVKDDHYGSGLAFRDPDHIALELFAPPS